MIALDMSALATSLAYVKNKKKEAREAATKQYRSLILAMYREVLIVSPQFSGDFVSNFDIETPTSRARAYQPVAHKGSVATMQQPHEAGDISPEFKSAYARGVARLRYIEYGDPVYFVNPTPLIIDSPEVIGPDGGRRDLRDPVVISAWESISAHLQAKYGT